MRQANTALPWAGSAPLSLSLLICTLGTILASTSEGACKRLSEEKHRNLELQHLGSPCSLCSQSSGRKEEPLALAPG